MSEKFLYTYASCIVLGVGKSHTWNTSGKICEVCNVDTTFSMSALCVILHILSLCLHCNLYPNYERRTGSFRSPCRL